MMTQTSPVSETLKPCPFCGLPPIMLATAENDDFIRCYEIRCDHCGIGQSEEYKSRTIELWNTRTSDLAQTQQQPVAWRWRPRGATLWIYNPEIVWLDDNRDKIEAEPLYTAVSDTSTEGNSHG